VTWKPTHRILLLLPAALMALAPQTVSAGNLKIIANISVKTDVVSAGELKSVVLEQTSSFHDGVHVYPVLQKQGPVHEEFLKEYVGQSDDELRRYFRGLQFTGTGSIPKMLDSDEEVVQYVSKTKGTIGYVSSEAPSPGVRILTVLRPLNGDERPLLQRVSPDYPESLKQRSIGGIVRLQIAISADGGVESVDLLGGNPILAQSAIAAVRSWRYARGRTRSLMEITIPFDPHTLVDR
jgi:TonB family protein